MEFESFEMDTVSIIQWLVHMLTELSYELLKGKATNQVRAPRNKILNMLGIVYSKQ